MFIQSHLNILGVERILESYANPRQSRGFSELSRILWTHLVFRCNHGNHGRGTIFLKLNALICVVFWFTGYMFLPTLKIILILVILSLFDIYMWMCLLSKFSCKVEKFFINLERETEWYPLCHCHGNSFVTGPVLIKAEIPTFCLKQGSYIMYSNESKRKSWETMSTMYCMLWEGLLKFCF